MGADPILADDDPNMVDLEADIDDGLGEGDDGMLDFDKGGWAFQPFLIMVNSCCSPVLF